MSVGSVGQVARSWVDVGSFHTRVVVRFVNFTSSVREMFDTTSYTAETMKHRQHEIPITGHNPESVPFTSNITVCIYVKGHINRPSVSLSQLKPESSAPIIPQPVVGTVLSGLNSRTAVTISQKGIVSLPVFSVDCYRGVSSLKFCVLCLLLLF
jgi:hypothetical protein